MHSMIAGLLAILAAALIAACANPLSPIRQSVDDPTVVAALAHQRASSLATVPDSVGIPPSIPPLFEEVPAELTGTK